MNNSAPRLKRYDIHFSIPGEAEGIWKDFVKSLSHFYANEREVCESIVAYAMWCKRKHHLTGPSFADRKRRQAMWSEVIADYPKESLAGSFFEHRMQEMLESQKK